MPEHRVIRGDDDSFEEDLSAEDISRIEALLLRCDDLDKSLIDTQESLRPFIDVILQDLAGPHLETMLESPQATTEFFANSEASLRCAALWLAHRHWAITSDLAEQYEKMASTDPDLSVRKEAVAALGTCYDSTRSRRIGHLLANIVKENSYPESIRLQAYHSLTFVDGWANIIEKNLDIANSFHEIDWSLVEQYFNDNT